MDVVKLGRQVMFEIECEWCDSLLRFKIGEVAWTEKLSNDNIRAGVITCLNCLMRNEVKMDTVEKRQVIAEGKR